MDHKFCFHRDYRPTLHPSGGITYLPTGLTRVTCTCGARFTIPPQEEPQRILPGRDTLFVVQRACT